jgi:ComB9 competence protein
LVTREFMTTSVVFPPWEKIEEIVAGDDSSYRITKIKPNVLSIRPNEFVGVDSSITAFGESGHTYSFYVRSEGYNSQNVSDITVYVRVAAPKYVKGQVLDPEVTLAEKTDYLDAVIFDPANLNFSFSMSGDKSIAPERVFSDGTRTWFDYGKKMGKKTLPSIYLVVDGVDTPINVTREGTKLVAQATGSFALKSGQKVTCVYPSDQKWFLKALFND